jgi:hypothetical protein
MAQDRSVVAKRFGVVVLSAALLGLCWSPAGQASGRAAHQKLAGGHATRQATAARRKRRKRPGCGSFCRQAGGFGSGGGSGPPPGPVKMPAQRIRVSSDGIIAIKATCARSTACVGAILVDSANESYGRADFNVPANATRHVLVGVPSAAIRYLRKHGKDKAFATVQLNDNSQLADLSSSKTLTILPPR